MNGENVTAKVEEAWDFLTARPAFGLRNLKKENSHERHFLRQNDSQLTGKAMFFESGNSRTHPSMSRANSESVVS